MTITCREPASLRMPGDPQLDAETASAARCATVLEEADLRVWAYRPELPIPGRGSR